MKTASTHEKISSFTSTRKASILLFLSAIIGLLASFVLTIDKIHLLQDPGFIPACNLNPIISCLSAMSAAQSELFGIPNSLAGIILYTALAVVAFLMLLAVRLPKVIWYGMFGFCFAGVVFVHYLIIQSLVFLHVLCPWCLTIWLTTPILVLSLSVEYMKSLQLPASRKIFDTIIQFVAEHVFPIALFWYTALLLGIAIAFQEYWAGFLLN